MNILQYKIMFVHLTVLVFHVITPCGLVGEKQRFGQTHFLHLPGGQYRCRKSVTQCVGTKVL
jgi:hypothetical protein